MTWVRLDDEFPDHPKIVGLSDRAFRAHVTGLAYCARFLLNGRVPRGALPPPGVLAELVAADLWSSNGTGDYEIHDYLIYQPTREEVLAERDERREQRVAAGKARAAGAQRVAGRFASGSLDSPPPEQPAEQPAPDQQSTSPVPVPIPLLQDQDLKPLAQDKPARVAYPVAFEEFWKVYPLHVGKGAALKAWQRATRRASKADILAGAERYREDPNRDPGKTKYAEGWLNADRWGDDPLPAQTARDPRPRDIAGERIGRAARAIRGGERDGDRTGGDARRALGVGVDADAGLQGRALDG